MANADDGSIWPHGYWRTWQPIVGATYATSLTKLRAWSNVITILLFVIAAVMLAYYFLIVRNGTPLTAIFVPLIPWAIAVGIIEWRRRQLAKTVQRNLAANGKPIRELPTFVDIQFLHWKQAHSVTTDDLEASAPKS